MCNIRDFVIVSVYLGLVSTAAAEALPLLHDSTATEAPPTTITILSAGDFQAETATRTKQHLESLNTQLKDSLSKLQQPLPAEVATTSVPGDLEPKNPDNNRNKSDLVENPPLQNSNNITNTDNPTAQQPEQNWYSGFSNNKPNTKSSNSASDSWNIHY